MPVQLGQYDWSPVQSTHSASPLSDQNNIEWPPMQPQLYNMPPQQPSQRLPANYLPPQHQQQAQTPFADTTLTSDDLDRLLDVPKELPDALSDFILKYSRRYTTEESTSIKSDGRKGSSSSSDEHSGHDSPASSSRPYGA